MAFLNRGKDRFVDASGALGLDLIDDGRSALVTDWDGDGTPDLILRHRTGPGVRVMLGPAETDRWFALSLRGTTSNLEAVGARVWVHTKDFVGDEHVQVREVAAGDGYLSQSSLTVHVILPDGETLDRVLVRWPGGETEEVTGIELGSRHRVVQGEPTATAIEAPAVSLTPAEWSTGTPAPGRVVLRAPIPVPPAHRRALGQDPANSRAVLANLWSIDCAPCAAEAIAFAKHHGELEELGLGVLMLDTDEGETLERAGEFYEGRVLSVATGSGPSRATLTPDLQAWLQAVLGHALDRDGALVLPTSLLVDERGWIQVIYLGPVDAETLLADAALYAPGPEGAAARACWPGRWYNRALRDWPDLVSRLQEAGRVADARYYEIVARREK